MAARMKVLLKGLRHISHIFDAKEEHEMQIGYPTDVKHVAHIGCDGASLNSPTWMKDFRSESLTSELAADTPRLLPLPLHDLLRPRSSNAVAALDSPTRGSPGARRIPRRRKQHNTGSTAGDSPTGEPSSGRRRDAKGCDETTGSTPEDHSLTTSTTAGVKKPVAGGGGRGSSSRPAKTKSKFRAAPPDGGKMKASGAEDAAGAGEN